MGNFGPVIGIGVAGFLVYKMTQFVLTLGIILGVIYFTGKAVGDKTNA